MTKEERAVRRYLQISNLERGVRLTEDSIEEVQREIDDGEQRLSELRKTKSELMKELRAAARDEGQLPLFDDVNAELRRAIVIGSSELGQA